VTAVTRRSPESRRRRVATVKSRVASPSHARFQKCSLIGCGRPTVGLAIALCRKHLLHRQRHGSPFQPSPPAATLRPYVKAALSFIDLHRRNDPYIIAALAELRDLMTNAPPTEIVTRLKGKSPHERSRQVWSRMLDKGVKPERILASAIAVHALISEAPSVCHRVKSWRLAAIAKTAWRLAGGKTWRNPDGSASKRAYVRAQGRVIQILGMAIEKSCELVIDRHLEAVLALKLKRYGPHTTATNRPAPR
jgi:hypothetical protein